MEIKVIIANAIGFIAFLISLIAFHKKEKEKIFKNTIISNILNLIHYLVLNANSGIATKIIAILRDLSMVKQEKYSILKSKKMLIVFVCAYIILMIITYQGFISIFSLLAALIYTIFCWNGDANRVRSIGVLTNILWFIYNISVKSYVGAMANFISIVSTVIAILNNNNTKKFEIEKGIN